jgi:lipopolysaccharide cholinephosphotransferase
MDCSENSRYDSHFQQVLSPGKENIKEAKTNPLQEKILEIAMYFDELCAENNITYYLMGGSALGAIRHNGFIPWDDDYDVFMTRENYLKFLKIAEYKLDEVKFYLQIEDTTEWPMYFSKLRMNGTTFLEKDTRSRSMHQGIYIDIMCLNEAPKNKLARFVQYSIALMLTAKTLNKRGYNSTRSRLKKLVMWCAGMMIVGPIQRSMIKHVRSYNGTDTGFVAHYFGKAPFKSTTFPTNWLGSGRRVEFEKGLLPVIDEVENYLKFRYGNYMDMPDAKTVAQYPPHAELVSVDNDYKNLI